ncbi:DUF1203 domain-containing protein [Novosphingobium huizhouense]|uniref:DUF1203 domain-containing protein n=1 Tax=Novosphingobium huizhouense TaxID=2866625 RepID=UPI001CD82D9D|nr:DUF1203 domain-containing protein [Novosphingobium huizhouense]
MTYRIEGLDPAAFAPLFGLSDDALAAQGARRVVAAADRGFPCRVTLEDARAGEALLLLHHVSHDVATPYRSAYAIYVREGADARAAPHVDRLPPVFAGRPIGLRGFDEAGMLRAARLMLPDQGDGPVRDLFADPAIAYIDAHNAAHGCFVARIAREGDAA